MGGPLHHIICSGGRRLRSRCCSAGALLRRAEPGETDLISAETVTATADFRLTAGDGEPSWTIGGFGKARYGSDGPDLR